MYVSETKIYVRPGDSAVTNQTVIVARDLVPTFVALMDSNTVLNDVVEKIDGRVNGTYTMSQIKNMKSAEAVNETEIMKITVTCADPNDAQIIADQLIASSKPVIVRAIRAEAFDVIDYATLPRSPSSPSMRRNLAIALLAGLIVSCAGIITVEMLDKRIKEQTALLQILSVPVIGVIPRMDQ